MLETEKESTKVDLQILNRDKEEPSVTIGILGFFKNIIIMFNDQPL